MEGHWLGDSSKILLDHEWKNVLPLEALDTKDVEPGTVVGPWGDDRILFGNDHSLHGPAYVLGAVYWTKFAAQKAGRVFPLISSQEQMTQLWELLKSDPSAVEHFLLTVLQPGVGTVDMSDHQLSATGQEG